MPWSSGDANDHKKGLGPEASRRWAAIANQVLAEGGSEKKAIRTASGMTRAAKRRRLMNDRSLIERKGLPG